jgi:hypothetical protein
MFIRTKKRKAGNVKLFELLRVIPSSARMRILDKRGEEVFRGYRGNLDERQIKLLPFGYTDAEVRRFVFSTDIYAKDYEKRGLMPPIDPEAVPDYSFSDLNLIIYYEITIS